MLANLKVDPELFHTADGTAFADLMIDGHRETWPIRGTRFRSWLRRRHYEATGEAPSSEAIRSALDLFEARAQFDGPQRAIHVRTAAHEGRIYLDLADDLWRAVEISPDGWRVTWCPPVKFRRAAGMLPLPMPTKGGSIEALAPFLNLSRRNDFVLVVAWLLAALRHGGPNVAPARTAPREERDLFIAASNGHLLAFDNLSDIPPWVSDALCRLASGGSFAVRQLYTDCDEVLFQAARPAILNGIEDIITRPDLADRAIFLTLPYIPETERRTESAIWREFEAARPHILGALLEAARHGLRALPTVGLKRLPRMADFALWATACEGALWPPGTFLRAYNENRRAAIEEVIEADPVATRVREMMAKRPTWTGSASELLRVGIGSSDDGRSAWPKSPRALAGRLHRAQTSLRALGIDIAFGREGRAGTRIIRMSASPGKSPRKTVSTVSDNDPSNSADPALRIGQIPFARE